MRAALSVAPRRRSSPLAAPPPRPGEGREPLRTAPRRGNCSAPTCGSARRPNSTSSTTGGGTLLHATSDVRSRGRGPMELRGRRNGRRTMRVNQRIYRVGGGHITSAPTRRCTSPTSAPTSAAPTGRSTSWPASSCAGSARRHARRGGPDGPKLNYCLRDLERTRPGRARPIRHYPGCNQDPYQDRVTLGTSVGWSDIYPADYDRQWINVAGLRGCFAFTMTVDPQHLLFESNERDNTSRASSASPSRARPAADAATRREADRGEGAARSPSESAPWRRTSHRRVVDRRRGRRRSRAGRSARRRRSPGRRRRAISAGTSSKRAGAGSPLRLAEVWKTGHIAPASGPSISRTPRRSGSSRQASG